MIFYVSDNKTYSLTIQEISRPKQRFFINEQAKMRQLGIRQSNLLLFQIFYHILTKHN